MSDIQVSPLISILITTFNRKSQLQCCLERVLGQTFENFEVIIIDDCSTDGTNELIASYNDPRIRYVYNTENVGRRHGDRAHLRRFVHELSRGKYFVYVCDDDFWISSKLLSRQLEYFKTYPNAAMVIGGQLSCFLEDNDSVPLIDDNNISQYLTENFESNSKTLSYFRNVFPKQYMTSDEFIQHFSTHPVEANIIVGATLYNKELFIKSGALQSSQGSKWQAGYELLLGPGCYGDSIYMDEPCILTEIRSKNASFRSTQKDHYLDSILSIEKAFEKPLKDWKRTLRHAIIKKCKCNAVKYLGQSYMKNTLHIKKFRELGMCTRENISKPVTTWLILKTRIPNFVGFSREDIKIMALILIPTWLYYNVNMIYRYYRYSHND